MFVRKFLFSIAFSLGFIFLLGQSNSIEGIQVSTADYAELWNKFEHFELYKLPAAKINEIVKSETEDRQINLKLGDLDWSMRVHPHDIRSHSARIVTEVNGETVDLGVPEMITYRGELANIPGSDVKISFTNDMIMGLIQTPHGEYFLENVHHMMDDAPTDVFILYETSSVLDDPNITCGMDEVHRSEQNNKPDHEIHSHDEKHENAEAGALACYELIVALACDFDFANRYGAGSVGKMVGILNLMQTNYDNEFNHEIKFLLGPTFVASGGNPSAWNLGSINALLSTYRNWANGGGFGSTLYDVSTLWFRRSFGGVIGLAWVRALCGGNRYNVCRDYTGNSNGLRNLQSHEVGHNFGFTHDASGSPHIMAPAVNGSNSWSSQSKAQFRSNVPRSFSCMAACAGGLPPIADFSGVPDMGCRPMQVRYTDLSQNNPSQWRWDFPGGTPSSSTQQNPVVNYTIPGRYQVSLEVTNGVGTDVEIRNNYIDVGDVPIALFDANVVLDEVFFADKSIVFGTPQYLWDFGDGNFANDPNPTHIYEKDGIYLVKLTVTTACGSTDYQETVVIVTPPEGDFTAEPVEGCVGTIVEFMDMSSENVDTYSWSFEGGSPGASNLENPVIKYDTAGTFEVVLLLTNSRYQTKVEKRSYIIIDSSAIADFDVTTTDLEVMFDNESKYGREYDWDFGDGGKSNQMNPTHTYPKDSTYEVRLISENVCDEDTIYKMISVGSLPSASFSSDKTTACLPVDITFADESSDNTTRLLWKFEGGTPASSTEASPMVSYDQTGEFKVTLIAINGLGNDTLVEEKYITIEDTPLADFDFTRSGYDINFNSMADNANSYNWDFGDNNTSTMENPMHTYSGDGDYNVILVVSNSCGMDTIEKEVSISNNPNANFDADQYVACTPVTINLENQSSTNAESFEWMTPGGNPGTSFDENPSITYNNPGLYRVTLIAKNSFGNDTIIKRDFIEILDVPVAAYDHDLNGFSIDFMENSEYGKEFSWDFGDGATSDLENPTHVYSKEGVFEVKMIVKNICGSDTITKMIRVTPRPIIKFDMDVMEICKGNSIQFNDQTENDPTDLTWKFEGGDPATSTDANPLVTYDEAGIYNVIVIATNAFGTSTDTFTQIVRVFDQPLSSFESEATGVLVDFENNSQEFGKISWDFGDGNASNEENPSHRYRHGGWYQVTLTIENPCGTDISKKRFFVKHRGTTTQLPGAGLIGTSPNPTTALVNLTFEGQPAPWVTIYVAGVDGQLSQIHKSNFLTGQLNAELDLSNQRPGSYMLFIKTEHGVKMTKVIVQE